MAKIVLEVSNTCNYRNTAKCTHVGMLNWVTSCQLIPKPFGITLSNDQLDSTILVRHPMFLRTLSFWKVFDSRNYAEADDGVLYGF